MKTALATLAAVVLLGATTGDNLRAQAKKGDKSALKGIPDLANRDRIVSSAAGRGASRRPLRAGQGQGAAPARLYGEGEGQPVKREPPATIPRRGRPVARAWHSVC